MSIKVSGNNTFPAGETLINYWSGASPVDYRGALDEALSAAKISIDKVYGKNSGKTQLGRGAHGDITYRIDQAAEEAIIRVLRTRFPNSLILSEEAGYIGDRQSRELILVDPLDGSANAVRPIPFFCSAVAICNGTRYRDLVAAGVKDMIHGTTFLGTLDQGVTVDGVKAQPSKTRDLDSACISLDIKIDQHKPAGRIPLLRLLSTVQYARFLGSAALETAFVSAGIVDAFVEPRPHLRMFDCLPSLFIVERAGGFVEVLNAELKDIGLRQRHRLAYVAAGNQNLGELILSLIKGGKEND